MKMLFLPPQRDQTRQWARTVAEQVPGTQVVVAESEDDARREIVDADAAFGTLPSELLEHAGKLRWLQAPAIAPPAGYYYDELVKHPVEVTNFRGIFNEHIAAHIMAFVLAFARGLHRYIPQQARHQYLPAPLDEGTVYLPASTALIVGSSCPLCPTISAFAKLTTITSKLPCSTALTTASAIPAALISGFKS